MQKGHDKMMHALRIATEQQRTNKTTVGKIQHARRQHKTRGEGNHSKSNPKIAMASRKGAETQRRGIDQNFHDRRQGE